MRYSVVSLYYHLHLLERISDPGLRDLEGQSIEVIFDIMTDDQFVLHQVLGDFHGLTERRSSLFKE